MLHCSIIGRKLPLMPDEDICGPGGHREVLVLQGGGALGAYQAGVYQALHETLHAQGHEPTWVAGISIGAINAALIAGNEPDRRIERLRTFWDRVSSELALPAPQDGGDGRRWFNDVSAASVIAMGVPGFFRPRYWPVAPFLDLTDAPGVYDTAPLHETLRELVNFDLINDGRMHFSVGAVNVQTGNFDYFENFGERKREIGPEHVMASGALPPGFPPVKIGEEYFWDGGLVSNTPLQYVLDLEPRSDMTIVQVDLFSAMGTVPSTVAGALQREKDIRYSSRTRLNTDLTRRLDNLRAATARLLEKLPPELRDDPDARLLGTAARPGVVRVLHLINRGEDHESQSKDYEFSRATLNGHWDDGFDDATKSMQDPLWTGRDKLREGIVTYDLTNPDGPVVRGDQG